MDMKRIKMVDTYLATIPCVTNKTQPDDFFLSTWDEINSVTRGRALCHQMNPTCKQVVLQQSDWYCNTWREWKPVDEGQMIWDKRCYSTPGPSYWLTVNRTTSLSPRSSNEMCEHIDYLNQLNNFFESTSWIKRQKSYIKIYNQCFLHASKPDSVFLTNCRRNAKYVHVLVVDFRVWFKEHKVRVQWMSIS